MDFLKPGYVIISCNNSIALGTGLSRDDQLFQEASAHLLRQWQRPEDAFVSAEVDLKENWWKGLPRQVVQAPSFFKGFSRHNWINL